MVVETKVCNRCNIEKSKSEFHRQLKYIRAACKQCRREAINTAYDKEAKAEFRKTKYKDNPNYHKHNNLMHSFGISYLEYKTWADAQNNVCAICEQPEIAKTHKGTVRNLSVDHNHETGKLRGLLCTKCNTALERVELVTDWEFKARTYLEKYK